MPLVAYRGQLRDSIAQRSKCLRCIAASMRFVASVFSPAAPTRFCLQPRRADVRLAAGVDAVGLEALVGDEANGVASEQQQQQPQVVAAATREDASAQQQEAAQATAATEATETPRTARTQRAHAATLSPDS